MRPAVVRTTSSSGNQNLGRSRSSTKALDGAVARVTETSRLFMKHLLPQKLVSWNHAWRMRWSDQGARTLAARGSGTADILQKDWVPGIARGCRLSPNIH